MKRLKKVMIYLPQLSDDWGGVRQYAGALLRTLQNQNEFDVLIYNNTFHNDLLYFTNSEKAFSIIGDKTLNKNIPYLGHIFFVKLLNRFLKLIFKEGNVYVNPQTIAIKYLVRQFKIDIIHSPLQFIPFSEDAKLIVTLHDVQEVHFPEFFSAELRAQRSVQYLNSLKRSAAIVVSFNHVLEDLVKYYQVPKEKIFVITPEFSQLWIHEYLGTSPASREALKLPEKYIFYPANCWPHKNHKGLLEAMVLLKKTIPEIQLVLTGHGTNTSKDILAFIHENNLSSSVSLLGLVSPDKLFGIYKHAHAVVVPTLYEAGSFPVIEAILLDVPVICANTTSLPETIGNMDLVFDPNDPGEIAEYIRKLWQEKNFLQLAKENNISASIRLRRSNSMEKIHEMYHEILSD